jgi:hypothetical protein
MGKWRTGEDERQQRRKLLIAGVATFSSQYSLKTSELSSRFVALFLLRDCERCWGNVLQTETLWEIIITTNSVEIVSLFAVEFLF